MANDDFIIYAVLLGSVFIFGGAAVLALAWAVRDGQFQNFERSARSIFDPAEPVGEATDFFPGTNESISDAHSSPTRSEGVLEHPRFSEK